MTKLRKEVEVINELSEVANQIKALKEKKRELKNEFSLILNAKEKNRERALKAWETIRGNKAEVKKTNTVKIAVEKNRSKSVKAVKTVKDVEAEKKAKNRERALRAWDTIRKNKAEAQKKSKKRVKA